MHEMNGRGEHLPTAQNRFHRAPDCLNQRSGSIRSLQTAGLTREGTCQLPAISSNQHPASDYNGAHPTFRRQSSESRLSSRQGNEIKTPRRQNSNNSLPQGIGNTASQGYGDQTHSDFRGNEEASDDSESSTDSSPLLQRKPLIQLKKRGSSPDNSVITESEIDLETLKPPLRTLLLKRRGSRSLTNSPVNSPRIGRKADLPHLLSMDKLPVNPTTPRKYSCQQARVTPKNHLSKAGRYNSSPSLTCHSQFTRPGTSQTTSNKMTPRKHRSQDALQNVTKLKEVTIPDGMSQELFERCKTWVIDVESSKDRRSIADVTLPAFESNDS